MRNRLKIILDNKDAFRDDRCPIKSKEDKIDLYSILVISKIKACDKMSGGTVTVSYES
jgi:hypothetical protein